MLIFDDRTRAEIDMDALDFNYRALRSQTGENVRMMAMVKADAYVRTISALQTYMRLPYCAKQA